MAEISPGAEFSAGWLALREPADTRARSVKAIEALVDELGRGREISVLDLGAGTGSNLRYLAGRLPSPQRWLVVDHDQTLLDQVAARMTTWADAHGHEVSRDVSGLQLRSDEFACHVTTRCLNLNTIDYSSLVAGRGLVTASALLDLTSAPWLQALASACREHGAAALFALSYDGRIECSPEEPEDATIRDLVNRHQRSDKGFGEALGPAAAGLAEECFTALGYRVQRASSDWVVDADQPELQRSLIQGWAQASAEMAPDQQLTIDAWHARRLGHIDRSRSRLLVGHQDVAAWLASV